VVWGWIVFLMTTYRRSAVRMLALAFALASGLALALGVMLPGATARTAPQYTLTNVADSAEDDFDPFSFGCAAINTPGDVAFRRGV
jgi:hypothetical protein